MPSAHPAKGRPRWYLVPLLILITLGWRGFAGITALDTLVRDGKFQGGQAEKISFLLWFATQGIVLGSLVGVGFAYSFRRPAPPSNTPE